MDIRPKLLKNSFFNVVKTFFNIFFPIVTFSYASHILGVDGIGRVYFAKSLISYFTMFAMLGMNYYGTREAARLQDDRDNLSLFSQEMLMINAVTTLAAYFLLIVVLILAPDLQRYNSLLTINSIAIVLQVMGMEWLYQALEEYQYIAIRSILFQIISVAALFLFVRKESDILPYAVILLISSSGSYILNFIRAKKYICFHKYPHYEFRKHFRPLIKLFAMAISIELYTVLDSTMLGFLCGDAAVGRYTAAVKVNKMTNTLITAAGSAMIPRFSYYAHYREQEKLKTLVNSVYNIVFMFSIPAAVGLFMLSDEIILLFSGTGFVSAGLTMRILTPIVVIIPFSIVANQQIFVPMKQEKLILQATLTGAVTNFTFNMLLIPRFAENGAAIATVLAEGAVTIVCFCNIGKFYDRKRIFAEYAQYWIAALSIPVIVMLSRRIPIHFVFRLCLTIPVATASYFAILTKLNNPYLTENMRILYRRLEKRTGGKRQSDNADNK